MIERIVAQSVAEKAGEMVTEQLKECRGEVLFLVSGGSAFSLLEYISPAVLGSHVSVGVLDERYSTDESVNNLSQLTETSFYNLCKEAECHFLDTTVREDESHEVFSKRMKEMVESYTGDVIVTMGIGEDGHTAGIMPFPENEQEFKKLFEQGDMVVGYDAEDKNEFSLRTTVTNTFLRECALRAVLFVSGENKRSALGRVMESSVDLHRIPGRIIHSMKNVTLVTDIE